MAGENTEIKIVSESDLANLLSLTGVEIPNNTEETTTIFSKPAETASTVTVTPVKKDPAEEQLIQTQEEIDAALVIAQQEEEAAKAALENGTKSEKITDISYLQDLVKEGLLFTFEAEEGKEEKKLEDYSKKEIAELLKVNMQRVREEEREKAPVELFESLPEKMQHALSYALNGGTNLEALFASLANSEKTENIDIATEAGQEQTVRLWLTATNYGTPEEIETELNGIKDRKELKPKAEQFKPKLDAKQQEIVEKQVKDAELRKKQGEASAAKYRENLYTALNVSDLDGLKLTPTIQSKLFNGLANFDKKASNGRATNGLGMLLEKYNSIEPNPVLIAKAYWLLEDPEGYDAAVLAKGNTRITTEVAKKLKTAESQKSTASTLAVTQNNAGKKTVKKPVANIFSRT